jgi:hypothetical protein
MARRSRVYSSMRLQWPSPRKHLPYAFHFLGMAPYRSSWLCAGWVRVSRGCEGVAHPHHQPAGGTAPGPAWYWRGRPVAAGVAVGQVVLPEPRFSVTSRPEGPATSAAARAWLAPQFGHARQQSRGEGAKSANCRSAWERGLRRGAHKSGSIRIARAKAFAMTGG